MKRTPLRKGTSKLNRGSKGLKRSGSISKGSKRLKSRPRTKEEIQEKRELKEQMWNMFLEVWKTRGPYSEISGLFLGNECKSVFMHHIFQKSIYENLYLEPENIIILSWDEHSKVESDTYFYSEINRRREEISKKFNICLK